MDNQHQNPEQIEQELIRVKENIILQKLFSSSITASPVVDKFSLYILAATGAIIALIISNLDKLLPILSRNGLFYSLSLLAISALFGLIAKEKSINIQSSKVVAEDTEKQITSLVEKYNISLDRIRNTILNEYIKAYPFFMRGVVKHKFKKALQDSVSSHRMLANIYYWQSIYTIFQTISFIGFIFIVAMYVKGN